MLPCLLISAKRHTTYRKHVKLLQNIQPAYFWPLLGVRWHDRVSSVEVLRRANVPSSKALLIRRQRRWVVHSVSTERSRLPKAAFYSELKHGTRPVGPPLLRYEVCLEQNLKLAHLDTDTWGADGTDRLRWRTRTRRVLNTVDAVKAYSSTGTQSRGSKPAQQYHATHNPVLTVAECIVTLVRSLATLNLCLSIWFGKVSSIILWACGCKNVLWRHVQVWGVIYRWIRAVASCCPEDNRKIVLAGVEGSYFGLVKVILSHKVGEFITFLKEWLTDIRTFQNILRRHFERLIPKNLTSEYSRSVY